MTRLYDLVVTRKGLENFAQLIASIKDRKRFSLRRPLFGANTEEPYDHSVAPEVDFESLSTFFPEHQRKDLSGSLQRLQKAVTGSGAEPDGDAGKGVREL